MAARIAAWTSTSAYVGKTRRPAPGHRRAFRGDRDGRQLCDLHGALAYNVASQDSIAAAVDDQLAEAECAAFDDRADRRLEGTSVVTTSCALARLRFGESHLRVFGMGEAAGRRDSVRKRKRGTLNGIGRRHEAVLDGAGHQHQTAGHVAGRKDVRRGRLQEPIHR